MINFYRGKCLYQIYPRYFGSVFIKGGNKIGGKKLPSYQLEEEIMKRVVIPYVNTSKCHISNVWNRYDTFYLTHLKIILITIYNIIKAKDEIVKVCISSQSTLKNMNDSQISDMLRNISSKITASKFLIPFLQAVNDVFEYYGNGKGGILTYNFLTDLCAKHPDGDIAYSIFTKMERNEININEQTYENVLRALGKDGQLELTIELFRLARDRKIKLSCSMYTSVIMAAGKRGDDQTAIETLGRTYFLY